MTKPSESMSKQEVVQSKVLSQDQATTEPELPLSFETGRRRILKP
jgi:hypothetical protein